MKLFQFKKPLNGFLNLIKRNKALSTLIVTLLIVALLLSPMSAVAITVSIEDLAYKKIIKGEEYSFYVGMVIESGERVPVERVKLSFTGPTAFGPYEFPASGGEFPYLKLEAYASIIEGETYPFGSWYGYGPFYGYGYGYGPWGWGYGYYPEAYGYGYYGYQKLLWKATLYTSELDVGEYRATAEVKSNGVWWGGDPTGTPFYIVDYTVSVSPSSLSIVQGGSGSTTVTVTSLGVFSSPVDLSISGLPTGVSASFSPPSVTPPEGGYETSTLTLSVLSTAPTGSYLLTITGSCVGASGETITRTASLTLTITPAVPPPPPPPPPPIGRPPVPTAEQIVSNPVDSASALQTLVAAGMVEEAAEALMAAAEINLMAAATCLANMGSMYAAQILNLLPTDLAARLLEAIVTGLLSPWKAADIMRYMDITAAAKVMKALMSLNLTASIAIAENLPISFLARLLAEIARIPNTPEKAALLLESISLDKAVQAVVYMVRLGFLKEAGQILAYLSDARLAAIWAGLPAAYREKLLPYLTPETLMRLKVLFRVVTFNLVIIPARVTKTVSYAETGVDVALTASKDTAGMVKTAQYVMNPYPDAKTPPGVNLKKFLFIDTAFPEGTISSTTVTIHYTDEEVKGLLEFTLKVYKYDAEANAWKPLPTTINAAKNIAIIAFEAGGTYALGGI